MLFSTFGHALEELIDGGRFSMIVTGIP